MTDSVASTPSFEHSGLVRMQHVARFLRSLLAGLPGVLAAIAASARRAEVLVRAGRRAWVSSRRQAAEDERTWNAALQDARAMAELSRSMQIQAR